MARLIPVLQQRGLSVSTIKHTHHHIDIDKPGKDSFIHRQAGAHEVMLATPDRWVLQHTAETCPPKLPELIQRMAAVDLIIVEGFHTTVPVTIEVYRPDLGKTALFKTETSVTAVATDHMGCVPTTLTALDLNATSLIADYILKMATPLQIP